MYRAAPSLLLSAPDRQSHPSEAITVKTNLFRASLDSTDAPVDAFAVARTAVSAAYSAFVRHIDDLTPATLHGPEATQLREAADACLFGDDDAVERLAGACELLARLSGFGRLESAIASRLHHEVLAVDTASLRLSSAAFAV
jgi:hypothetical protein